MPPRRLGKHAPPPPDGDRCRRSDGKQWRCPEPALPGFALCKYHHRRSYQNPNPNPNPSPNPSPNQSPNSSPGSSPDPPSVTVTPFSEEQKPWKLRIKKPSQPNSEGKIPRNPNPIPPSPSSSDAETEPENGNPKILPTVLALEHSKSEGRKRRGRKPNSYKLQTPVQIPKPEIDDDNNNNNNINNNNDVVVNTSNIINNSNDNNNNNNNNNNVSGSQRCKRSDGRGWQCKARALIGEHYCDHHYKKVKLQQTAKLSKTKSGGSSKKRRRAADVAVALAKRRRGGSLTSALTSAAGEEERRELPKGLMTISPSAGGERARAEMGLGEKGEKLGFGGEVRADVAVRPLRSKNAQPVPVGPVKRLPLGGKGRRREKEREKEGGGERKACHRCGEAKAGPVVRCKNCFKRYFCSKCITIWYGGMSKLEINTKCPVCRNCCTCDICTRLKPTKITLNHDTNDRNMVSDTPIQDVVNGESKIINIKYASYPFAQLLAVIKKLSVEQLDELEIEAKKQGKRVSGTLVQVLEKGRDEQLNCDICEGSIKDLSMNCSHCNFKLCLTCSHKIRKEEKFENSKFENWFINCKNDLCESNSPIFHSCGITCPSKESLGCEGKLGLVYSFPIGWSETLIIGQENKSSLVPCKTNGHLNNENNNAQMTTPSGFV